ncbi:MAG: adenosylcobinamide amidohydrolase [Motiliproteus sp.]|nr:adenosylcobinamide amidohydrolase [Motiliproteus sp.]MCW9052499.1 adenosylcobinamide amidohydrolase [Motiliproteus sp.]
MTSHPDWRYTKTDDHLCVEWPRQRSCLSCAVLNGGAVSGRRLVNLKVSGDPVDQLPEQSLQCYADQQGWRGTTIGLMTAASMNSLRIRRAELEGEVLEVFLTCGLSNARRAGDPADWVAANLDDSPEPGTINILLITTLTLPMAAQVELIQIITEAKCAALQNLETLSPVSGESATGTGTDATVIVSGEGREERWAGKHTPLAEAVARLVIEALTSSISKTD